MIKKVVILIIIIQGVLMSATLESLEINSNKVPFIFEEDRNLPIVSMQLIFKNSGFLSDTQNGLTKLTAKLLNEGTKKDGSVGFATKLENRAINLSIQSGAETFVVELNSLKSEFNYGVELLKELLNDPNYTKETLTKIKTQTIGELKRKESDFDYISMLKMKSLLFPNTTLAKPSLGTIDSVSKISIEDIKRNISTHLGLGNAIVVMGGDINISEASKLIDGVLKELPDVKSEPIPTLKAVAKKQIEVTEVKSKQAYIYFGSPLDISYSSSERYLSKVASFILGSSGFGSRLMEEIRVKKGLAYSAYSRFSINKSNSYFWGYLQTKVKSQDEAIKSVKEVISLFLDKGATAQELESAKQFLLGSEPLRNETLSQRLNRAFMEYYHNRPLGATVADLEKIRDMKLEELNSFISKHREIIETSFSVVTGDS
jgi:predicted Zn-dependent peptidase